MPGQKEKGQHEVKFRDECPLTLQPLEHLEEEPEQGQSLATLLQLNQS